MMKQLLRMSGMIHTSHRFRSKSASNLVAAKIAKRLNYENKLLFGKLLESSKDKTKRLSLKKSAKSTVSSNSQVNPKRINDGNVSSIHTNEKADESEVLKKKGFKTAKTNPRKSKTETEAANEFLANLPLSAIEKCIRLVKSKKMEETCAETKKKNEINKKETENKDTKCPNPLKARSKDLFKSPESIFNNASIHSSLFNPKEHLPDIAKKDDSFHVPRMSHCSASKTADFISPRKDSLVCDSEVFPNSASKEVAFEDTESELNSDAYCLSTLFNVSKQKYSPDAVYEIDHSKLDKGLYCPSVSIILQESMSEISQSNLERWRENKISEIGQEQFDLSSKAQIQFSSELRARILRQLKGKPVKKCTKDMEGYWKSLLPVFPLFQDLKEIKRIAVHSTLGYKGMIDCLVEFRDKLMLVCWKKSEKIVPSLDSTFDTPLQISAYVGAINFDSSYPFMVEDALLVMSYSNGTKADIFHLDNEKLLCYWRLWLRRLSIYEKRIKNIDVTSNIRAGINSSTDKINIDKELTKMIPKKEINTFSGIASKSTDTNIEDNYIKNNAENPKKVDADLKKTTNPLILDETNTDSQGTKVKISDYSIVEEESSDLILKNAGTETSEQNVWKIESCLEFPLYNEEKSQLLMGRKIKLSQEIQYTSCPSVTTILSETKSETAKFLLERWKQNLIIQLGIEGFEEYQKNLLATGSSFHKLVQDHLRGIPEEKLEVLPELKGCWKSLKPVFPMISCVNATESKVAHEMLKYKGIIDCVAQFRDKLVVIDWKKSDKIKSTIGMTYDGPLQIAAYIGALNFDNNYPFKVDEGLLVVSYTDGTKADIFHIDKKNCLKYWKLWLERLHKYRTYEIKNCLKVEY